MRPLGEICNVLREQGRVPGAGAHLEPLGGMGLLFRVGVPNSRVSVGCRMAGRGCFAVPVGCRVSAFRLRGCCSSRVGGVLGARGWSRSVIRRAGLAGPAGVGFDQVVASAFGGEVGRCGLAGRPGIRWSVSGARRGGAAGEAAVPVAGADGFLDPVGDRAGLGAHVDQLPGGGR